MWKNKETSAPTNNNTTQVNKTGREINKCWGERTNRERERESGEQTVKSIMVADYVYSPERHKINSSSSW